MKKLLIGLLLLSACGTAAAQDQRTNIFVWSSAEDSVGKNLVYKVREGVRQSAGFRLTDAAASSQMQINIRTLDPSSDRNGVQTTYSAVFLLTNRKDEALPYFFDSRLGYCGRDAVDRCSVTILAIADEIIALLRAQSPK